MKTFHIDHRTDVVTNLPSFRFTRDTAVKGSTGHLEQSTVIPATDASYFSGRSGIMRLQFDLFSYNYFKFNTSSFGHIIAVARYQPVQTSSGTLISGQGLAIGNVSNLPNGNISQPSIQAASWSGDMLLSSAKLPTTLKDSTQYRIVVDSIVSNDLVNQVRFQCYQVVDRNRIELIHDTGPVKVGNPVFSPSASGVLFGHVSGNISADLWKLEFTNVKVIWGGFDASSTDCSCPRQVTARTANTELFDFTDNRFRIGFDYSQVTNAPDSTPVFGFKEFATRTEKGFRLQKLNSTYCRVPSFLDLGIKFNKPEIVLSRNLRPNIAEPRGYDDWEVEVKGSVTVLHDAIEFKGSGKTIKFNKLFSDKRLELGKTHIPAQTFSADNRRLDTATFIPFDYISPLLENQRTIRKNIFFIFQFEEITYYLVSGHLRREKFVVGTGVDLTVSIPIDIGQQDCCDDSIDQLPAILPPAILPDVEIPRITLYLNYETQPLKPVNIVGGTSPVIASISPNLPKGLQFNTETAEIQGTPSTVFPQTDFLITFTDAKKETAVASFNLRVDSGAPT